MKIARYSKDKKREWDEFIAKSKNGWFLFKRDYMDYHSDRFKDFSLMFYDDNKLVALLPANADKDTLYSHEGLTYGGIISDDSMKTPLMLELFDSLRKYAKENKIKKIIYKAIPFIYHKLPAQEDLYALYRNNAKLVKREVSSTIFQVGKLDFNRRKKRYIVEALDRGLTIKETGDFESFHNIVNQTLKEKYGREPVHSADEMSMLAKRFPENISLFGCFNKGKIVGGALVYATSRVAHVQYLFSSSEGKSLGANDLIGDYLINRKYADLPYFNFGISTENNGLVLNEQLISFKEEFGARAIAIDTYEISIN
ncbi:GNAT family N-acetyltransferase [Candidatus Woesearchaeota archaeon]|nr:GNAT family N-acetyltransferase [Candidatus Woesearchaeota archaeon]